MSTDQLKASALQLGFLTGARSFTPTAALCWGSHLGWFSLKSTPFAVVGGTAALSFASLLAAGELIGDKLPNTPARTAALPLIGRMALGATAGAVLTFAASRPRGEPQTGSGTSGDLPLAVLLGAVGALLGTFATFYARRALTEQAGLPDLPVALLEDGLVVAGACKIASRFRSRPGIGTGVGTGTPEERAHA